MNNRTRTPRFLLTPQIKRGVIAALREGLSGKVIAESFGIARSSVSNIAIEAGLRRSSSPRVTADRAAEIVPRYLAGESGDSLGAEFGIAGRTVRELVRRAGGTVRGACRVQRPLRHDAFDVLTPEAAYWLGMMFTDGTISRRGGQAAIALGLKECDRGHLVKFRDFLGSDHAITERKPKQGLFGMSGIQFVYTARSQQLADRLDSLGRYGPAVDPELAASPHFWRGCIDGDGTVGVYSTLPTLKLFGSSWLLGAFVEFLDSAGLRREHRGRRVTVRPCQSIFAVSTTGTTAHEIVKVLYENAPVSLDRKAVKAVQVIAMRPPFGWPCNKKSRD